MDRPDPTDGDYEFLERFKADAQTLREEPTPPGGMTEDQPAYRALIRLFDEREAKARSC